MGTSWKHLIHYMRVHGITKMVKFVCGHVFSLPWNVQFFSRHFNNVPSCISGYPPIYASGQLTAITKPILTHSIYIRKHFLSPLLIYLIRISFLIFNFIFMFVFNFILHKLFRIYFPSQYTLILLEFISISIFIFVLSNCILICPYFLCQNRSIRFHTCTTNDNTGSIIKHYFLAINPFPIIAFTPDLQPCYKDPSKKSPPGVYYFQPQTNHQLPSPLATLNTHTYIRYPVFTCTCSLGLPDEGTIFLQNFQNYLPSGTE